MFYAVLLYALNHRKDSIMKKIITIVFIVPILVFAELDISKVNSALFGIKSSTSSTKSLKFYNNNSSLNLNKNLKFTSQKSADIVLFPKEKTINKILIVDSYKALKENQNSIGAIYVKKSRTQIIFVKERLEKNGFKLLSVYKKYIIPECQLNSLCFLIKK
jgi:hypothetical protein